MGFQENPSSLTHGRFRGSQLNIQGIAKCKHSCLTTLSPLGSQLLKRA